MIDNTKILDEAYSLYMPQIRSEISSLEELVSSHRNQTPLEAPYYTLEIGTKYGGTFYLWNSINNGPGMNISIDMSDGGKHGGISEEEMNKRDIWFQERFGNCVFIRGNSHSVYTRSEFARKLHRGEIFGLNSETQLDFLFIDGDHTYEGVKMDWEMYSPFVRKGGIIAFHDITISEYHHSRDVHVGEFWNELTNTRKTDFQNPDKDVCIIDGNEYEILQFVEAGNNWGGIGACILR